MAVIDYPCYAQRFLENASRTKPLVLTGESMLRWDGNVYRYLTDAGQIDTVFSFLMEDPEVIIQARDPNQAAKIRDTVRALLRNREPPKANGWLNPTDDSEREHSWIAFENGTLDLTAACQGEPTFRPGKDPRFFTTIRLPYEWNGAATSPLFEYCVHQWMEGDMQRVSLLQEYIGYCLRPDLNMEAGLFLEGTGANGKSVFCHAVTTVLGQPNVSAVPLEAFTSKYDLYNSLGKLANIATETDMRRRSVPVGKLKSYISGDLMQFEQKYMPTVYAAPTAKLIVAWNRRPVVNDESDGFWRRLHLVPFNVQFKPHQQDPLLREKLTPDAAGIFNWALIGLKRLMDKGHFTAAAKVTDNVKDYNRESDPLKLYLLEHYKPDEQAYVPKAELQLHYNQWCNLNDEEAATREVLFKAVKRVFPKSKNSRVRVGLNRIHVLSGIGKIDAAHEEVNA